MTNRLALGFICSIALANGSAAHAGDAAEYSTNAPPTKVASAQVETVPTKPNLRFTAEMVLSLDRSQAIEQFRKTGRVPPSADRMTTDDTLAAFYIVSGCQPDARGECNVTARSRIIRSDGSYRQVTDPPIVPFRVGKKVPEFDSKTTYAQGSLNFSILKSQGNFDPEKVAGDYLFLMTFTDNNDGNEINLWKVAHVSAGPVAQR